MSEPDPDRSAAARRAAELALVRVCHHYGARPEFVLISGLVPGLLCSDASVQHAGTSDVDVQVNLEIAGGAVNAGRLEHALRNAEFSPDAERVLARFGLPASMRTPLLDLQANVTDIASIGAEAYARQISQDHPELDPDQTTLDGVLAVRQFTTTLLAAAQR